MNYAFKMSQGNQVKVADTLCSDGSPIDLTGATVKLLWQGPGVTFNQPATITDPANGKVQYTFASGDTPVAGDYSGQWQVTDTGGNVQNIPAQPFNFLVEPGLPITAPAQYTLLSDFYDDIRAMTGDFKRRMFQDADIASVMRLILRMGKVKDAERCGGPTIWSLTPDLRGISPAMNPTDVHAYALLIYNAAFTLIQPNVEEYRYRTRALSEQFGERRDFIFNLENALYEIEDGRGVWHDTLALRNWLFAINGIWVWNFIQAEQRVELSFH